MPVEPFAQYGHRGTLRVGFVPLLDAAPLIAALELGFFAQEGLHVRLDRQIGWGNVRDKLTYGHLDASHALIGMPLLSVTATARYAEPLVVLMNLGSGGDAITISARLVQAGVTSAALLAQWLERNRQRKRLAFAHVFCCSMHHYLLRDWLASAGIDPDVDVSLTVLPPPQMVEHMAKGYVDCFCVGEPWNTLAQTQGTGSIVALTTDLLPAHPEKALVVSQSWARDNAGLLVSLVRAILRAAAFCDDCEHYSTLAEILSRRQYLDISATVIEASLNLGRNPSGCTGRSGSTPSVSRPRDLSPGSMFPSGTHHVWLMRERGRWQHQPPVDDPIATAKQCIDSEPYRKAAASLDIECPPHDFPPMPVRFGSFNAGPPAPAQLRRQGTILPGVLT